MYVTRLYKWREGDQKKKIRWRWQWTFVFSGGQSCRCNGPTLRQDLPSKLRVPRISPGTEPVSPYPLPHQSVKKTRTRLGKFKRCLLGMQLDPKDTKAYTRIVEFCLTPSLFQKKGLSTKETWEQLFGALFLNKPGTPSQKPHEHK